MMSQVLTFVLLFSLVAQLEAAVPAPHHHHGAHPHTHEGEAGAWAFEPIAEAAPAVPVV